MQTWCLERFSFDSISLSFISFSKASRFRHIVILRLPWLNCFCFEVPLRDSSNPLRWTKWSSHMKWGVQQLFSGPAMPGRTSALAFSISGFVSCRKPAEQVEAQNSQRQAILKIWQCMISDICNIHAPFPALVPEEPAVLWLIRILVILWPFSRPNATLWSLAGRRGLAALKRTMVFDTNHRNLMELHQDSFVGFSIPKCRHKLQKIEKPFRLFRNVYWPLFWLVTSSLSEHIQQNKLSQMCAAPLFCWALGCLGLPCTLSRYEQECAPQHLNVKEILGEMEDPLVRPIESHGKPMNPRPPSCLMSLKKRNWARVKMRRQLVPVGSRWFLVVPFVPWGPNSQSVCYLPDHFLAKIWICTSCIDIHIYIYNISNIYIYIYIYTDSSPATKTFGRTVVRSSCPSCVSCACVFSCASEVKDHMCVWKCWYTSALWPLE